MTKTFIYAQLDKEGYHNFPEASFLKEFSTGDYYDVNHLSLNHMHYFHIKVWVEVSHTNRQVEFIQLRRWLNKEYFASEPINFGNNSCEMIAHDLINALTEKYPGCELKVDISEDNINGALVEFSPFTHL
jgi:hypothetical protein